MNFGDDNIDNDENIDFSFFDPTYYYNFDVTEPDLNMRLSDPLDYDNFIQDARFSPEDTVSRTEPAVPAVSEHTHFEQVQNGVLDSEPADAQTESSHATALPSVGQGRGGIFRGRGRGRGALSSSKARIPSTKTKIALQEKKEQERKENERVNRKRDQTIRKKQEEEQRRRYRYYEQIDRVNVRLDEIVANANKRNERGTGEKDVVIDTLWISMKIKMGTDLQKTPSTCADAQIDLDKLYIQLKSAKYNKKKKNCVRFGLKKPKTNCEVSANGTVMMIISKPNEKGVDRAPAASARTLARMTEKVSKKAFIVIRECLKHNYAPGVKLRYSRGMVRMFSITATLKLGVDFDVTLLPVDTLEGSSAHVLRGDGNRFQSDDNMNKKLAEFAGDVHSEDRPDQRFRYRLLHIQVPKHRNDPLSKKANVTVRINQMAGEAGTCSIVGAVSEEQLDRVADIVYQICTELGGHPERTNPPSTPQNPFDQNESTGGLTVDQLSDFLLQHDGDEDALPEFDLSELAPETSY